MTRKTILVVGAAGQFAGLAVTALSQLGARVRGFVRNADQTTMRSDSARQRS
jgi:uncharacterized protein YbjT (DUF2867 family)